MDQNFYFMKGINVAIHDMGFLNRGLHTRTVLDDITSLFSVTKNILFAVFPLEPPAFSIIWEICNHKYFHYEFLDMATLLIWYWQLKTMNNTLASNENAELSYCVWIGGCVLILTFPSKILFKILYWNFFHLFIEQIVFRFAFVAVDIYKI